VSCLLSREENMIRCAYKLCFAVVGMCFSVFSPDIAAMAQSVPTIQEIAAVWKARQDDTPSARFEWTETLLIPKGAKPALRALQGARMEVSGADPEPLPLADTRLECSVTYILSRSMLRINRDGSYWQTVHGRVEQNRYVNTFDGEVSKEFFDERTTDELHGFIWKDNRNKQANNPTYLPMALAFRPCDIDMGGLHLEDYRVSPSVETINGCACVVLSPKTPGDAGEGRTIWLDPNRGFLALRTQDVAIKRGRITTYDISYEKDHSHRWVPSQWKSVATGGHTGCLFEEAVAKVTRYTINSDIPRSEFQLEFPAGTYVSDYKKANAEDYIVRDGGAKRIVTSAEFARGAGGDYRELLNTESGMARRNLFGSGAVRLVIILVSAVVICAAVFYFRRLRRI